MVTTRGPSSPSPPNRNGRPDDAQAGGLHSAAGTGEHRESGFDRQLARLYGDSLFGPWLDPGQYLAATRTTRRHGAPFRRLAVVVLFLWVGAVAGWIVRAGLSRRAGEDREQVARSLASFLREGELDRVAQFLALLRGNSAALDAHDPQLDLIIRSEAALYRYQDADPARLGRIKPYLSASTTGPASGQRVLASLAVASRQERAARLAELEPLRATFDRDPEFHYLVATALEHKGEVKAARQAWDRACELGPLWLAHRYEQAWFEARQGKPDAVSKLVGRLMRVAPDSAWAGLAARQFGGARRPEPDSSAAAASARPAPVVALYHQHFALALAQVGAGDPIAARRSLAQAIAAVNGQAAFVFDAFDWLVEGNAIGLARDLTGFEDWPQHSELAAARVQQLAEPQRRADENPPAASESKPKPGKHIRKPGRGKAKARRRK